MMPLSFANPWMLTALVALPFLWWLLRVMPPSPRRISFPPLRHLLRLQSRKQDPATTPLWLALLRLLLAFVLILAAAHPLGSLPRQPLVGPLLLVVDDGWAAAKQWAERQAQMTLWLDRAERAGQPVLLLATAPPADGGPIALSSLLPVGQARSRVQALVPHPWSCDHLGAAKLLDRLPVTSPLQVVWLADGLDDPGLAEFAKRLAGLGPVERIAPKPGATAKLLSPPRLSAGVLSPRVRRAESGAEETVIVRALDGEGRVLAEASKPLRTGEIGGEVPLPMPSELRLRVTR
ncbi:MAG TPA: hypothetical protein HPP80_09410, partial [Rhodospirillaceae bacterium]|nr:hypothetical protein [Rhodospirillaceae bacterium]